MKTRDLPRAAPVTLRRRAPGSGAALPAELKDLSYDELRDIRFKRTDDDKDGTTDEADEGSGKMEAS